MYIKDRLITVQGHPEFDGGVVAEIAKSRYELGLFDLTLYEDAMSRVYDRHDGVLVANTFVNFLIGGLGDV